LTTAGEQKHGYVIITSMYSAYPGSTAPCY